MRQLPKKMQVIGFFKTIGAASMVAPIDWGQDTWYANTTGAAMDAAPVVLRRDTMQTDENA
jgi:hypothetical protein